MWFKINLRGGLFERFTAWRIPYFLYIQWRHNERDGVWNNQPQDCLLNRLFRPGIQAQVKKHQSSASLAFVRGIRRWPVNSPHKGPVTRKMFPFDDVIMMGRLDTHVYQTPPFRRLASSSSSVCTCIHNDRSHPAKSMAFMVKVHKEEIL